MFFDDYGQNFEENNKVLNTKEETTKKTKRPKSGLILAILANIYSLCLFGIKRQDMMALAYIILLPLFLSVLMLALTNFRKDKPRCIASIVILAVSVHISIVVFLMTIA